jgi:hypothetical protein
LPTKPRQVIRHSKERAIYAVIVEEDGTPSATETRR